MAVNGAYKTPLITPHIPTRVKLLVLTLPQVITFVTAANRNPVTPPRNKDGAKIPPEPPEPMVSADAIGFIKITPNINPSNNQASPRL